MNKEKCIVSAEYRTSMLLLLNQRLQLNKNVKKSQKFQMMVSFVSSYLLFILLKYVLTEVF